jgi:hypothetical protein
MINDLRKGGGVYFDAYGPDKAELRLTTLRMDFNTAIGKRICITFKDVCDTMKKYCRDKSDVCRYSFFDPISNTCCPACEMQILLKEQPSVLEEPTYPLSPQLSPPSPSSLPPAAIDIPPSQKQPIYKEPTPPMSVELETSMQCSCRCKYTN